MTIYLNTPKIHSIKMDNVDEAAALIKKLSEEPVNMWTGVSPPVEGEPIWLYNPKHGFTYTTCNTNTIVNN